MPTVQVKMANFLGGVNSSRDADLIRESEVAWASNATFRGGKPKTRPPLKFVADLPDGKIQGASYFSLSDGCMVYSIAGRIYKGNIIGSTYTSSEITPLIDSTTTDGNYTQPDAGDSVTIPLTATDGIFVDTMLLVGDNDRYMVSSVTDGVSVVARNLGESLATTPATVIAAGQPISIVNRNSSEISLASFCEAESFMIIQDGTSKPVIYNGGISFRAVDGQIPVGTSTVYGNGRIWVGVGKYVYAGDILTTDPNSILEFSETEYLSEGMPFQVPEDVTGMAFIPRMDSATETGDLFVFTRHTTSAIKATIFDRTTWKSTAGMFRTMFPRVGGAGQKSIAGINQDIWFRSDDGQRSVRNTVIDMKDNGLTPMSANVNRLLSSDSSRLLKYIPCASFDNRILMGASPRYQNYTSDYFHVNGGNTVVCDKLIALDFSTISEMGKESAPAYDGEWSGIGFSDIISGSFMGENRCFIFSTDSDGKNRLWELMKNGEFDYYNEDIRIQSALETRYFDFGSTDLKRLIGAHVFVGGIYGSLDWSVKYKEQNYPCYRTWRDGTVCAKTSICDDEITECTTLPNYQPGFVNPIKIGSPPAGCDSFSGKNSSMSNKFQFQFNWTGQAKIDEIRFIAETHKETLQGECSTTSICNEINCCQSNYLEYSIVEEGET